MSEWWDKLFVSFWVASGLFTAWRLLKIADSVEDQELSAFDKRHPWFWPTVLIVGCLVTGPLVLLFSYMSYKANQDQ